MTAFWKTYKECKFIEESMDGSGVYFFRNLHGVGTSPKRLSVNMNGEELQVHMTCNVNLRKRATEAKEVGIFINGTSI